MTPRHKNLMRALSTGKPTTAKELRREGHTETVTLDGVDHFTTRKPCAGTTVARAIKAAPELHSVWN